MVAMGPGAPAWAWDAPEGHEGYDELRRAGMTDAQIGIDRARREPPEVAWVTPDQLRAVSVSVNIFFTIFTNVFSPIAPTRMRRIRQRGCAAFGV